MDYQSVITFWFEEIEPKSWWIKDENFDQLICERFHKVHQAANACELYSWRQHALGRLAEIIVLDQFSRNIYRDRPAAFASDSLALALSQEAVSHGCLQALNQTQQAFLIMPYMHSESQLIHTQAVELFQQVGNPDNLEFEYRHKAIIDRFARYPHRNAVLGRQSSAEEIAFLAEPGSSF